MPRAREVDVPVGDVVLRDPAGGAVPLSSLTGVLVVVLMRHRH